MNHKGTITLETERLILRRFTNTDDEAMFRNWCADPGVTKYLMWKPHDSIEETRQVLSDIWISRYDEPDFYQWAIEAKDIHEPIGSIGAVKQDDKTQMVHIGYCIGKAWWRNGYTSEALTQLVRFFFEEVGIFLRCFIRESIDKDEKDMDELKQVLSEQHEFFQLIS